MVHIIPHRSWNASISLSIREPTLDSDEILHYLSYWMGRHQQLWIEGEEAVLRTCAIVSVQASPSSTRLNCSFTLSPDSYNPILPMPGPVPYSSTILVKPSQLTFTWYHDQNSPREGLHFLPLSNLRILAIRGDFLPINTDLGLRFPLLEEIFLQDGHGLVLLNYYLSTNIKICTRVHCSQRARNVQIGLPHLRLIYIDANEAVKMDPSVEGQTWPSAIEDLMRLILARANSGYQVERVKVDIPSLPATECEILRREFGQGIIQFPIIDSF